MKFKAITLIELMVVIAIIGTIAVMSIPSLSRFSHSIKLSGAAKELVVEIRKAQQMAVTEQINHQVSLDQTQNKYQVIKKSTPEVIVKEIQLPSTITFLSISLSPHEVSFNAAGAPSQSGTIQIVNRYNKTITIEINPAGFIKTY
ncbi:MAG: GspH/FimT family pseudopilin [Candidatus Berkelbacteria bacterium]|nr:GspH/FimT family pseudopilin [Candidatus Berkelbacteria bacterium]